MKRESSMSRSEGGKKIFILFNAELMNNEASNSLLKVLEEPLPDTVILLTTSAKESLLPTILSRCQTVQCDFLLEEDIFTALQERDSVENGQSRLAARLANGSYGLARLLTSADMAAQREEVVDFYGFLFPNNGCRCCRQLMNYQVRTIELPCSAGLKCSRSGCEKPSCFKKRGTIRD